MSRVKFKQILYQVIKYAPTQLLNASFTKIKKFEGLRKDEYGRVYAYARTYSTKVYNYKLRQFVKKRHVKTHHTFIMINPAKGNVVLSCSCDDFKYRHEVALYKRGGAEIEYSNGFLPHKTNPRNRFTCCKHCLRLYDFLSKRYPKVFVPNADLTDAIG